MQLLPIDWWIELRVKMRHGFRWGFAEKFYKLVRAQLDENETANRHPNSWTQLILDVRLDDGDFFQKRKGKYPTHIEEFLTICALLRIEPSQAPPDIALWLRDALLKTMKVYGRTIPPSRDIELFVAYSLQRFYKQRSFEDIANGPKRRPSGKGWDIRFCLVQADFESVGNSHNVTAHEVERAVLNVKSTLEAIL